LTFFGTEMGILESARGNVPPPAAPSSVASGSSALSRFAAVALRVLVLGLLVPWLDVVRRSRVGGARPRSSALARMSLKPAPGDLAAGEGEEAFMDVDAPVVGLALAPRRAIDRRFDASVASV
jgi:hypothetical protein